MAHEQDQDRVTSELEQKIERIHDFSPPIAKGSGEGRQYGDNWNLCFCKMYGNKIVTDNITSNANGDVVVVGNGAFREPHIIYNSEHQCVSKHEYEQSMMPITRDKLKDKHQSRTQLMDNANRIKRSFGYTPLRKFPNKREHMTSRVYLDVIKSMMEIPAGHIIMVENSYVYGESAMDYVIHIASVPCAFVCIEPSIAVNNNILETSAFILRYVHTFMRTVGRAHVGQLMEDMTHIYNMFQSIGYKSDILDPIRIFENIKAPLAFMN